MRSSTIIALAAAAAAGPALAAPVAAPVESSDVESGAAVNLGAISTIAAVAAPLISSAIDHFKNRQRREALEDLIARAEEEDESGAVGRLDRAANIATIGSSLLSAWQSIRGRDDAEELFARGANPAFLGAGAVYRPRPRPSPLKPNSPKWRREEELLARGANPAFLGAGAVYRPRPRPSPLKPNSPKWRRKEEEESGALEVSDDESGALEYDESDAAELFARGANPAFLGAGAVYRPRPRPSPLKPNSPKWRREGELLARGLNPNFLPGGGSVYKPRPRPSPLKPNSPKWRREDEEESGALEVSDDESGALEYDESDAAELFARGANPAFLGAGAVYRPRPRPSPLKPNSPKWRREEAIELLARAFDEAFEARSLNELD